MIEDIIRSRGGKFQHWRKLLSSKKARRRATGCEISFISQGTWIIHLFPQEWVTYGGQAAGRGEGGCPLARRLEMLVSCVLVRGRSPDLVMGTGSPSPGKTTSTTRKGLLLRILRENHLLYSTYNPEGGKILLSKKVFKGKFKEEEGIVEKFFILVGVL